MSVRTFNGSGDVITLDNGILSGINNNAALSAVVLANPLGLNAGKNFISIGNSTATLFSLWVADTVGGLGWASTDPNGAPVAAGGLTASTWQVLGISKAAGTATPRVHRKELGVGSWTHADTDATVGTSTTVATDIYINQFADTTGGQVMDMALLAIFTSQLTDTDFVNIESNATTQWIFDNLSPAVLCDLNQAATSTAVVDLSGNGSDQTALAGTSVNATTPAWTFGVSGTNATVDMTGVLAAATAASVAPPKPRPTAPFLEVNVRMQGG